MTPQEAIEATGKRSAWIASQMRIGRVYLWRLVHGERHWRPEMRHRFALAVGLPEAMIDFDAPRSNTES